jgi:hypothetical protein
MAYLKLQVGRALKVVLSDTINIPNPSAPVGAGATTGTGGGGTHLIDSTQNFITQNVRIGDIIYNLTDGTAATVSSILNATTIVCSAAIFSTTPKSYGVYPSAANENGCVLYVGTAGDVRVLTIGGDTVTFTAVPAGTFMPVSVKRVYSTGTVAAASILALW